MRNRLSAAASRQRKKEQQDVLQDLVEGLRRENAALRQQLMGLGATPCVEPTCSPDTGAPANEHSAATAAVSLCCLAAAISAETVPVATEPVSVCAADRSPAHPAAHSLPALLLGADGGVLQPLMGSASNMPSTPLSPQKPDRALHKRPRQ